MREVCIFFFPDWCPRTHTCPYRGSPVSPCHAGNQRKSCLSTAGALGLSGQASCWPSRHVSREVGTASSSLGGNFTPSPASSLCLRSACLPVAVHFYLVLLFDEKFHLFMDCHRKVSWNFPMQQVSLMSTRQLTEDNEILHERSWESMTVGGDPWLFIKYFMVS